MAWNSEMNRTINTVLSSGFVFALSIASAADAPFQSTVELNLNTIDDSVSSAFTCLEYNGRKTHRVFDKRISGESAIYAYSFTAVFNDQAPIEIVVNPEFESSSSARESIYPIALAMGRVYAPLRHKVGRIVMHKGHEGLHAGGYIEDYGLIVVYQDTIADRLRTQHLEESLFHESVHAAWDKQHANSDLWRAAQLADDAFITQYAADNPKVEDLAETALLVYGFYKNPDAVPSNVSNALVALVPNRMKVIRSIMEFEERLLYYAEPIQTQDECNS